MAKGWKELDATKQTGAPISWALIAPLKGKENR